MHFALLCSFLFFSLIVAFDSEMAARRTHNPMSCDYGNAIIIQQMLGVGCPVVASSIQLKTIFCHLSIILLRNQSSGVLFPDDFLSQKNFFPFKRLSFFLYEKKMKIIINWNNNNGTTEEQWAHG